MARGFSNSFPLLTEVENGQIVRHYAPHCARCDYPTKISFTGKRLPEVALVQVLRKRGWETSPKFLCPKCRDEKRAAPPVAHHTNSNEEMPMAEQPRTPTPEERRRIRDALEEHYLEDRGCYAKSWSDKSLAAKLDMPAKWISDLREANGYGPDANEAAAARSAEVDALAKDMADLQADLLRRFDDLERRMKKLSVDQSYAA